MRSRSTQGLRTSAYCLVATWCLGVVAQAHAEPFFLSRPVQVGFQQDPAAAPDSPAPAVPSPAPAERPVIPAPIADGGMPLPEQPEGWGFDPLQGVPFPYEIEPWISVTGQLVWLNRSEGDRDTTLVDYTTAAGATAAIGTDHLNFSMEAGVRASVLLGPADGRYVELLYLGVFDQEERASVRISPTGVLSTTMHFFNVDTLSLTNYAYTVVSDSSLHSPELNVWLNDGGWRFRPMFGARWLQQTEDFHLYETNTPGNGNSLALTNDLVGGQLGFHTVLWQRTNWFGVQAVCKAGLYHNNIDLQATQNAGGTPVATLTRSPSSTSFSGEVNVTAVWQLTPHLNFHVGYTGLWLTEVATATEQINQFDFATGAGEVKLGGISYQGGHFGVTYAW